MKSDNVVCKSCTRMCALTRIVTAWREVSDGKSRTVSGGVCMKQEQEAGK
jgi:hypothetical protein